MVRKVVWSSEAEKDLISILEYYFYEVDAKQYARKLDSIFYEQVKVIELFPQIGKESNAENIRIKIVGHYQIIYEVLDTIINILRIWDSRQNPYSLDVGFRKK